jgi:hypothetical protein
MIYFLSIKVHLQSLVLHLLKMNQAYSQWTGWGGFNLKYDFQKKTPYIF